METIEEVHGGFVHFTLVSIVGENQLQVLGKQKQMLPRPENIIITKCLFNAEVALGFMLSQRL